MDDSWFDELYRIENIDDYVLYITIFYKQYNVRFFKSELYCHPHHLLDIDEGSNNAL